MLCALEAKSSGPCYPTFVPQWSQPENRLAVCAGNDRKIIAESVFQSATTMCDKTNFGLVEKLLAIICTSLPSRAFTILWTPSIASLVCCVMCGYIKMIVVEEVYISTCQAVSEGSVLVIQRGLRDSCACSWQVSPTSGRLWRKVLCLFPLRQRFPKLKVSKLRDNVKIVFYVGKQWGTYGANSAWRSAKTVLCKGRYLSKPYAYV